MTPADPATVEHARAVRLIVRAPPAAVAGLHLEELVAAGNLIDGGVTTNDRQQAIGSIPLCEFETREALEQWIGDDVHMRQGVWKAIEVLNLQRLNPAAPKG